MATPIDNETVVSLLQDLGLDATHVSPSLISLATANSRYLKDLKLNVSSTLGSKNMTRKEAYMLALSITITQKHNELTVAFERLAKNEGATDEEIGETHACASIMGVNNIFYRFRHYMHDVEFYNKQPAGLRMSVLMNPVMGKGLFELMSLVVSAVNGCERCVVSHEASVKEHGADEPRIYDAIRLGAVIKGLCTAM
ncbi:MAG: alkylhydroperoxidase AhpD family core domain protein [Flavipsychrobacter sp.]|nr:alkylhydroperoxidase AhpD family core domain protein [Flavipsychrobacter sp.]